MDHCLYELQRGLFSIDLSNPFRVLASAGLCCVEVLPSVLKSTGQTSNLKIAGNCFTTFVLLRINAYSDEPVFNNINTVPKKCILHLVLKSQPQLSRYLCQFSVWECYISCFCIYFCHLICMIPALPSVCHVVLQSVIMRAICLLWTQLQRSKEL